MSISPYYRPLVLKDILLSFVKFILLFMYIYEFNFTYWGLPTFITSRRVAVLLLLFIVFIKYFEGNKCGHKAFPNVYVKKAFINMFFLHICLFLYISLIITSIGRGEGINIIDFIVKFIFFGLLAAWGFAKLFDSIGEIMSYIICISLLQSAVVLLCLIVPEIGVGVDTIFVQEGVLEHRLSGYAGGIACITAPGFFRFSLGLVSCVYFILCKNRIVPFLIIYLFLTFIGTMMARTGLIVGSIGLMIIIFCFKKQKRAKEAFSFFLSIIFLLLIGAIFFKEINFINYFEFSRLKTMKEVGVNEAFFDGYFAGETTVIPPISLETIVGTGITSGKSGNGIFVNVDGGFFRLYVAYGLIICVLFYIYFFITLFSLCKKFYNVYFEYTFLFFFVVILLAEYKEFSIYEQYLVGIFFSTISLAKQNDHHEYEIDTSKV